MIKHVVLTLFILVNIFNVLAQTKRIAHRSHSANLYNYAILEDADNLGNLPQHPRFIENLYFIDSTIYRHIDSINSARILDSLHNMKTIDSSNKLYSAKKLKDTLPLKPTKRDTVLKIQEQRTEEKHKKQSFPLPLLLLIAIPATIIAIFTKGLKL